MAQKDYQSGINERTRFNVKTPRRYKVILLNDDFTPMDFVVMILMVVFGNNRDQAEAIMLNVHHHGHGIAGIYTRDDALTRCNKAIKWARSEGYPLRAKCEPE